MQRMSGGKTHRYEKWRRQQAYLLAAALSLVLALLACRVEPPKIVMEEDTPTPQVLMVTQVVTQVITPTPAPQQPQPTAQPTATTPPEPTVTPTWSMSDAPIYYPLEDCVASRLRVGDKAMVSLVGGPNGIRYGRDIHVDTIALYAQPGDILEIVGGPWCSQGWLVWMVRTADGFVGYTPEGDGNNYWLFPLPPGS